jgi:hypothetical protein
MSGRDPIEPLVREAGEPSVQKEASPSTDVATGMSVEVRELIALADDGHVPMLLDPLHLDDPVMRARTAVDLHGAHIGRQVVVAFERGDRTRPIVMGVLMGEVDWPALDRPTQFELAVDDERLLVSARSQLVLRCGKASITLTKAGKVLVEGTYVLSRATGVNRVKGSSVQLN